MKRRILIVFLVALSCMTMLFGCREKGSLTFTLVENNGTQEYSVTNIGTCDDADVVVPETYEGKKVTSIGAFAFDNCDWRTSFTLPSSVTSIGDGAFSCCRAAKRVNIPDGVKQIGRRTFVECNALESIVFPDSVKSIGDEAFAYCCSLTNVEIGKNVQSIGDEAFTTANKLASLEIPDSVKSIGVRAFFSCASLTTVTYQGSIADWHKISIGRDCFSDTPLTEITCLDGSVRL